MADSEISTTLPIVPATTGISTSFGKSGAFPNPQTSPIGIAEPSLDPAVVAGRHWRAAHGRALVLCKTQQELETKLHRSIGTPRVSVEIPGHHKPLWIASASDIDSLTETYPEAADAIESALADFDAHQLRWREADRELGYSIAREQEAEAAAEEERLAGILWSLRATSLEGVVAKFAAVVATGEPKQESTEFPWAQIRSALADLKRISQSGPPNGASEHK